MDAPRLSDALAAATARFPELDLESAGLRDFLAEPGRLDDERYWAEVCLAYCCGVRQPRALQRFEREYLPAARQALGMLGLDEATIDDRLQQLRARFFVGEVPRILDYRGAGSLEGWVRATAGRLGLDARRHATRVKGRERDALLEAACPPSPESEPDRARLLPLWREAFRRAVGTLSSRERALLTMSLVHGASIDSIGELYAVHRSTAARWLDRIRETLRQRTFDSLAALTGAADTELQSLTRLVLGVVEVSLERQLRQDAVP